MGLFGSKPTQEKFARMVMRELRRVGETRELQFCLKEFELRIDDTVVLLHNAHADYCEAGWLRRSRLLAEYVSRIRCLSPWSIPDSLNEVRDLLIPSVRGRFHTHAIELEMRSNGRDDVDMPNRPLGEHFSVEVAISMPQADATVSIGTLDDWSLTFDEALLIAEDNLRRISDESWTSLAPGVWASPWEGAHDASRLFLPDLIGQLEVKGDHVAAAPCRYGLLVTGSRDELGLVKVSELIQTVFERDPSPLSGMALRLVGTGWIPYLPPLGHPARDVFAMLRATTLKRDYQEQRRLLDALNEHEGTNLFVAGFDALQQTDTGAIVTHATWAENVETLLPEVDRVVLVRPRQPGQKGKVDVIGVSAWSALLAADLLTPEPGLYPPRFRATTFPTKQQRSALGLVDFP